MNIENNKVLALAATVSIGLGAYAIGRESSGDSDSDQLKLVPQQISPLDLPDNVISDIYGDGKRTVSFRVSPPVLARQVVQACSGDTLVTVASETIKSTDRNDPPGSFTTNTRQQVQKSNKICKDDGHVTPGDNAPIPRFHSNKVEPKRKKLQGTTI